MTTSSTTAIDAALQDLERQTGASGKHRARKPRRPFSLGRWLRRLAWGVAALVLAGALPFVLLVRTSVYVYRVETWPTWGAVAAGVAATVVLLLGYAALAAWRWRIRLWRTMLRVVPLLVVLYASFALLYVSGQNVKTPGLQATYTALHPLLRLGVSTLVLVDRDLVITDTARTPDDYLRMGLSPRAASLHYQQEATGYVHAVDLRTQGRPEWQNALVQTYFEAMGYRTLRHVGTADHLHVALPLL